MILGEDVVYEVDPIEVQTTCRRLVVQKLTEMACDQLSQSGFFGNEFSVVINIFASDDEQIGSKVFVTVDEEEGSYEANPAG